MLLNTYLQSPKCKRYLADWATTAALLLYFFFVAEHARPFARQFKLSDATLQHPFALHERVTGHACLVLASLVPSAIIAAVTVISRRGLNERSWHVLQVSLLGLAFTIAADGVITDILKGWVGRPRPDFLSRCGPQEGTPYDRFVGIEVCTAPLGERILTDGMRSTPSGHSSISFSAFLYLAMWLYGQFQMSQPSRPVHMYLLTGSPLLLASYVALSRVQDYRHHFVDIFSGGALGCTIAMLVYNRYFNSVFSKRSPEPLDESEEGTLPL